MATNQDWSAPVDAPDQSQDGGNSRRGLARSRGDGGQKRRIIGQLRLVGRQGVVAGGSASLRMGAQPISGPTDPRWVLAVRTAEELQGDILSPERRQRLLRLGHAMGLTPFSANLVIAIVQDQARRGYAAQDCPTAGEPQLCMVGLASRANGGSKGWRIAFGVLALLAVELAVIRWWLLG